MNWTGAPTLADTPFTNITVGGKEAAAVQNVGNFSFARVYGAGHEVVSLCWLSASGRPELAREQGG